MLLHVCLYRIHRLCLFSLNNNNNKNIVMLSGSKSWLCNIVAAVFCCLVLSSMIDNSLISKDF